MCSGTSTTLLKFVLQKAYQSLHFTNAIISIKILSDGDAYVFELSKKNYIDTTTQFSHCTHKRIFQLLLFYKVSGRSRPTAALQPPYSRPAAAYIVYSLGRLQDGCRAAAERLRYILSIFLQKLIHMLKNKFQSHSGKYKL